MKASIDIGTNTVLLLIGEEKNGVLIVLREEYRMPRLGKGVDHNKKLHQDSVQRVLCVLKEYKIIIDSEYPTCEEVIITATSAVRDAHNRQEFLQAVKDKIGLEVRLLSGDEEAQFTYFGALVNSDNKANHSFIVLDIGGGSTEIAVGTGKKLSAYSSIDMGSVRFTERFFNNNPPKKEEIVACRNEIGRLLEINKLMVSEMVQAVGVAGTVTTFAIIDAQITKLSDYSKIHGMLIDTTAISSAIDRFSGFTHQQLFELSADGMNGREDIFYAGLLILEGFLKFYNLSNIMVSTGGIRHGALLFNEKDENSDFH